MSQQYQAPPNEIDFTLVECPVGNAQRDSGAPPPGALRSATSQHRSAPERKRDADRHEHAATSLVETPPDSPKPRADAMRHAGDEHLGDDFDGCEGRCHDGELDEEASRRIDELGKKGGEEKERFG